MLVCEQCRNRTPSSAPSVTPNIGPTRTTHIEAIITEGHTRYRLDHRPARTVMPGTIVNVSNISPSSTSKVPAINTGPPPARLM